MVDDDLSCKCPADGPVRIRFLKCLFDTADVLCAAFIERGAEAHDQELVLADLISVAGIIQGRVARVAAEVIGIRVFAFHQSLLLIGQRVPGIAGCLNVRVSRLCAFLHIDRVDQRSGLSHRVRLRCCFCCCGCGCPGRFRCCCRRRFHRGSSFRCILHCRGGSIDSFNNLGFFLRFSSGFSFSFSFSSCRLSGS